jgi:hypothetical protein
LIGGACSLATRRSRGCRPNVTSRELAPETLDEVRTLLARVEARDIEAAIRLAALFRREALDDRNLIALIRDDDPELAPALARLCLRPT